MSRAAALFSVLSLSLGSLACSLTVPGDEQDGVVRCQNVQECPAPSRGDLEAVCNWGPSQDQSSPRVCWEDYKSETCGDNARNLDLQRDVKAAMEGDALPGCSDDTAGEPSCPPKDGECNDDQSPQDGVCPGPDGEAAREASDELKGRDISDQFCRSFFCSEDWVCGAVGSTPVCVPCDPEAPVGEGGCGKIYSAGKLAPGYADISSCEHGVGEWNADGDDDDDDDE
ncbi:MAG: hypothetical protein B7733_07660 [Myxococcales bacterium FL481]|nr:MAG: hypothetical protein B7733_07660 [Myxococcales bacterium FL481]